MSPAHPTHPAHSGADIATLEDCRHLVELFYGEARADALLGPVFQARVHDWQAHLDVMARFWFTILFAREGYHGNPLAKHLPLPITRGHFDRWLAIWHRTVDATFEGPRAQMAKARADRMADVLDARMHAERCDPSAAP